MPARLTNLTYLNRIRTIHGKAYSSLEAYVNSGTRLKTRCNACLHIWDVIPRQLIGTKFTGCPNCCSRRRRKTTKSYSNDLRLVNPNIHLIGEYKGYTKKHLHRCALCEHRWKVTPNNTLFGHGCPACKVESNSFKRKLVKFGNRTVNVQGYEPQALAWLLSKGVTPEKVLVSTREGKPSVTYTHLGKSHLYVPDFYHTGLNRIIEVKSTYTLGLGDRSIRKNFGQTRAKARACLARGFTFTLLVMNPDGTRIKLPRNWHSMTRKKLECYLK